MTGSTGSRTSTIFKKCKSPIDFIRALCLSLVTNNKHGRSFFYAVNKQTASQQNDLLRCVILTRSLSCHIRPHCLIVSYLNVFFFLSLNFFPHFLQAFNFTLITNLMGLTVFMRRVKGGQQLLSQDQRLFGVCSFANVAFFQINAVFERWINFKL